MIIFDNKHCMPWSAMYADKPTYLEIATESFGIFNLALGLSGLVYLWHEDFPQPLVVGLATTLDLAQGSKVLTSMYPKVQC